MTEITKVVELVANLNVVFSGCYKENRHGTKIIAVVINIDVVGNGKSCDEYCWEAKAKIPKQEGEIDWEFLDEDSVKCPDWVINEVTHLYDYEQFMQLISDMRKSKVCK